MFVYVLDKNGQPLMPTQRFGKVRRLLNSKQAKVVRRCPFTIQLLYEPESNIVQKTILGVDTGSKHVGVAAVGNNKVLYQSQVELRDNIKLKMDTRRQCRRNRRFRKTRYRKARWLNRANSRREDRLPPTMVSKVYGHTREIEFVKLILPISNIILEVSQFDTHLTKNPLLISEKLKHWGYQKGFDYGFASRKEAILNRDNYTCQCCGKKHTRLEVHHIIYRSQGGTNDENNLITLCEECHSKIHSGELALSKKPKKMNLKYATQMSIIRSQLLECYSMAIETFGFVTKTNREALSLPKDHYIDAVVVASGGQLVQLNDEIFYKKCVARQDRQLCKGTRGEKRIPTGKLHGFRKFDKVIYLGKEYFIKGRRSSGTCVLMDIFGQEIDFSYMPRGLKIPKMSNCQRINAKKSFLVERRSTIPLHTLRVNTLTC